MHFIVLLIPTKEAVFHRLVNTPLSDHRDLIEKEERVWNMTKTSLDQNEIPYLDALPALQKQFDNGNQPYNVTTDGHPNRFGHRAIAEVAASYLKSHSELR